VVEGGEDVKQFFVVISHNLVRFVHLYDNFNEKVNRTVLRYGFITAETLSCTDQGNRKKHISANQPFFFLI
jgi:hypothetical protein